MREINLGRVTAYADAVNAGYTGTREEFAVDLANAATYAAEAGDSAAEAKASEDAAALSASTAAQAAVEAAGSEDAVHADAVAAQAAKTDAIAAKDTAVSKAGEAANSASAAGLSAAAASASETAAGAYANTASSSATSAIGSASAAAESASAAEDSATEAASALGDVTAAKTEALAAIQTKGEETLESIPEDYTALRNDVSSLKSDFDDKLHLIITYDYQYVDMSEITSDTRYNDNLTPVSGSGYFTVPVIKLDAGTYHFKNIFASFSYYVDAITGTKTTFSSRNGSITFNNPVNVYITGNASYGNAMIATSEVPVIYTFGFYNVEVVEGLIKYDDTLQLQNVGAESKAVGDLLGVNGYQYLDDSNFVENTRYDTTNLNVIAANGFFTYPAILLPAGTYYFRNVYTDFSHIVNAVTGVRTQLASITTGGRVTGSVTIDYDFYLYLTGNYSFDTLAYGKVVWSDYPYYSMQRDRIYGIFGIRANSNRYSENTAPIFTVDKNGNGDFTTLKEGIETAVLYKGSIVKIGAGEYDLINEFGSEYFENLGAVGNSGLQLYNDITLDFSSDSLVTCNYTGDNPNVKRYFSPFNLNKNAGRYGGFTIKNLHLECSNVRYGIHDEANASYIPYTNKYLHCSIKIDNRLNTEWNARQCIGGGLGDNSEIVISGCIFESLTDGGGTGIVSYHNSDAGRSNILIKDSYFKGSDTVKVSYHGTQTKVSTAIVCGCSLGSVPYVQAESASDTTVNMELIAWNNEIRN